MQRQTIRIQSREVKQMEEQEYSALQSGDVDVTIPISIIQNEGQVEDPTVKFLVKTESSNIYLSPDEIVFSTLKEIGGKTVNDVITSNLLNSNQNPRMTGLDQQQGTVSFFSGSDPTNWYRGVPTFNRVLYQEVYRNIDRIISETEGNMKGDFIVHPGGNYQDIRIDYDGARRVRVRKDGTLVVRTPWGRWTESAPVAYQEIEGDRIPVEVEYILFDAEGKQIRFQRRGSRDAVVGFQVGAYDPNYVLEIDPILEYSTYLGGSDVFATTTETFIDLETVIVTETQVEIDQETGQVIETTITTEEERQIQGRDFTDTFELFSSPGNDAGYAIAVDSTGAVYITGETTATNFPSTSAIVTNPPIDPGTGNLPDFRDAFVTKLDANGDLVYSAYISGGDRDRANGIAVDSAGSAYIVGETESTDFPVISRIDEPFQEFAGGSQDAFVAKLNPTGTQFDYASYLGGVGRERGIGIFVNSNEFAYVTGQTNSQGLGTDGAFQSNFQGGSDAFIAKVNPEGSGLEYFTYIGGSEFDEGVGIAEDDNGEVYISGTTESSGLATLEPTEAFQTDLLGRRDAFVTKLNADGSEQVYFTYIGGGGGEVSGGLVVDNNGAAYITGITPSPDFPTTPGSFQEFYQGGPFDAYLTKVDPSGAALEYSTFIGGSGNEGINFLPQTAANIAVDRSGTVHIIGTTTSTENSSNPFPITTETAAQPTFGGGITDAFIIRLNPDANTENNEEDLIYASYWGGGGNDEGYGITLDETGAAYITGMTLSTASESFPTTAEAYQSSDPSPQVGPIIVEDNPQAGVIFEEFRVTVPNREDAFVSKFAFEGVVITEFGGSVEISEDGATDIYSLELAIQPTDSVRIDIAPDDQSTINVISTGSPDHVIFTQADWDRPQRIEVTSVDDTVLEGPHESTITHSISSADPNYSIIPVGDVVASVGDNEFEIQVAPTTGLRTSEGGESDEFTVVLGNVPTSEIVTIPISSLDPEEGLVSSGVDIDNPDQPTAPLEMIELFFTPENWNIEQAVTVTGVDDDIEDGDREYTIAVGPAFSENNDYDGLDAPDVTVTNREFSIQISAPELLRTTEEGDTGEFTVVLGRQPTADVRITIMSSNINEGLVSTEAPDSEPMEMIELVFTPENWDTPQTVVVTGVDNPDETENVDVEYSIIIGPAESTDSNYGGQELPDIQAINIDRDSPPVP
ncbi:MAG: SBBP repeat-containing protein, partial [Hormoscilla sp.]